MELSTTRRGNKHIPLGCRFVPYDQWFLTHIPPTWKIRHLKQHILAKCLHLPWDARKIEPARDADVETVSAIGGEAGVGEGKSERPPSPITFAPDEKERPNSPIEFASPASPPGVDGVQQEKEKLDGEAWEELGTPTEPVEDEGELAVIPGGRVEVPSLGGGARGGFIPKPIAKLAASSSSSSIPFSPLASNRTHGVAAPPTRISQPYGTRPDEQIHIAGFTLVRFTTGQILEDDYSIAWYQLAPHELVELHASRPQRGFSVAVQLTRLLEVRRGPGGVLVLGGEGAERWWEDVAGEEARSPGGAAVKDRKGKGHAAQPLSLSLNAFSLSTTNNTTPQPTNQHENTTTTTTTTTNNTTTTTTPAAPITPYSLVLTSLARHDLNSYIQPYWEGWVRCLRVVWRPDTVSSGVASGMVVRQDHKSPQPPIFPYSDYGAGFTSFSGGMGSAMVPPPHAFEALGLTGVRPGPYGVAVGLLGVAEEEERERERRRERERERRKRGQKLEWRERWVVIRDGWVYLCKERDEPNPTHRLPLAGLLSLRGVEHLAQEYHNKGRSDKDKSQDTAKDKERRARRDREREEYRREKDRARDRERRDARRRSTSTPRVAAAAAAAGGGGGSGLGFFGVAKDRDVDVATMPVSGSVREKPRERDRERDRRSGKDREKDKDRERDHDKRRKTREREERELDYLRRWDDIPLGALFGKSKDKEKEREKERERERVKEKERERERRERYKERERAKERELQQRERERRREKARSRSRSNSTERPRQTQSEYAIQRERSRSPSRPDKGKDKDKANNHHKERDTTTNTTSTPTPTQPHRTTRNPPDPTSKSYIPYTHDEAEAAGMKILCAKFKSAAAWEREQKDREARRAILRARMEGRVVPGGEGAMASTTSFGSTSTLTLTLAGGVSGVGGAGGEKGLEKERERRYTSTGPTLAAALASYVPPPPPPPAGVVAPPAAAEPAWNSEGVQGHKSGVGVFEMDALHPQHPPPPPSDHHHHPLNVPALRKGSLPTLGGLGKLVGASGSSTGTDTMVGSPLITNITPGSSGSGSGSGKFSIGLFGVGKDKDKEDEDARATRKREERERKEREKRQKAIDKELKKERKRREGGGDLDEEEEVGSALSWRLGGAGKRWGRGSIPTPATREDNEEWERLRLLEKMEPITFAPTPAKRKEVDIDGDDEEVEDDQGAFSKSVVSIPTIADSATLHDLDYMEPLPSPLPSLPPHSTTTTPTKPKLRVSTSSIGADAEIHSDSDSCSVDLSSPVFAHSTDSEGEDPNTRDDRRAGYRYGGYHAKEKDKEKEKDKVKTKDVVDVDKAEGKPDTQVSKEAAPAAAPVRRKEVDRGEWVILDMGNDHAFNSILRLLHRHFPPPLSSTFVSDAVEETPLSPTGTVPVQNPVQEKPSTKPVEENNTPSNEDDNEDNDEDDDIYHTAALPHPPVLTSIHPHLPNPLPPANPAVPYPEWRTELVHRARRHGMREEGRALDLALHGWGREFEEMEQRSGVFKRRRRKEEEGRRRNRRSFVAPAEASGLDEEEDVEEEDGEGKVVDPKRMSEVSHVSTINAADMNASAAAVSSSSNNAFMGNEEEQEAEPRISKMPSSSSSDAYTSSQSMSIDSFLSPSESESDSSSSESESEWVAWHTDLPRQRFALQAAKLAERERVRERRRERMRVLEEEERERMHRMLSLKRQQSTSTLPEAPLSPLTFSNPFAGDSPLEDGLTSPIGDVGVVRAPSTGAVSLHPSIHPSIASSSSSDYQLPPRTQEEERRRYLETRRALEPSATSHITITTTRSSAVPFLSATSYSPSSGLTPQQHRQSLAASTLSIGSIRRSASPSSISSVHTHAQGLRPSTSFHSQSQQRSGYGEHVRSPSEQGGRELAVGSPSEESFGGYWRGLGSSPTPSSISNSPSPPTLSPSWAPRAEFIAPNPSAITIAVDVVSSSSVSTVVAPPFPVPFGYSSSFASVMDGNSGRLPFAPSSPTEDPRQRRQQPYEFGSKVRDRTSASASPPPPLPPTTSQHGRTHSRSFSGTASSSYVPYRVTVSGAGHVAERSSDREEEEREHEEEDGEEEEEQVSRGGGGGGGTLPIHINTSPPQLRGGGNAVHGQQSPRSPPPLLTTFSSRASPKSPSSPSRPSPSPSTSPNHPSTINSTTNSNANTNTITVAMPILTREQINQIESETEERLMRMRMGTDGGGLPLPPSPGGLGFARGGGFNSDMDGGIGTGGGSGGGGGGYAMGITPRRSSSAGLMSTRSSPTSPRLNPGTSTTASSTSLSASVSASSSTAGSSSSTLTSASAGSGSSASVARPASILLAKSYPFPPSSERERERRVLRKRPSDLGMKISNEVAATTKGSTAAPTPTTTMPMSGSSVVDNVGSGSPAKKHAPGQIQRPKLSLSGLLSSPSSSAVGGGGGGGTSPTIDAQSPTFPRYGPSAVRSPTTPTATGNARSFSGINSPPSANTNAYTTPSSSSASNSNATIISTQIQPSQPIAPSHGTMASAKALLRRVRSGSSLRPGMGVHPEEEADGIESLGSVAGAAVLGDGRSERGSGGRSKGAIMERIARGLDSGF